MTRAEMHAALVDILCDEWGPEGPEGRADKILELLEKESTVYILEDLVRNHGRSLSIGPMLDLVRHERYLERVGQAEGEGS
jgi:hypothetical protein